MVKKLRLLVIGFIAFLAFGESVLAVNLGYMGTSAVGGCAPSGSTTYLWADSTYHDDYFTSIQFGGNGTGTLQMVDGSGNLISEQSYTFTSTTWNYTKTFSGTDVKGLKLCLDSGSEVFFMYGELSNTNTPTATFDYTTPTFEEPPVEEEPPGENDPCEGYLGEINPDCPNYVPPDGGTDPPDDGGGTTDPPDDGTGGSTLPECPGCGMFECPNWSEYMGKVDEIIAGIPTITDAIAQQTDIIKNDVVGQPPSLPSEPSQPTPIDSYNFENSAPAMTENEDLGSSGFTLTDLEEGAPVIEFREDPTGGFDIVDPVDALPAPPSALPIPGETDAGEWDNNKPAESEVVTPEPPIVEVDPTGPPVPSEESSEPPSPGDSGGGAPVPSTETPINSSMNYKTHPDNPDGV